MTDQSWQILQNLAIVVGLVGWVLWELWHLARGAKPYVERTAGLWFGPSRRWLAERNKKEHEG